MDVSTDTRALFPRGMQSAFLEKMREEFSMKEIAYLCACSERTIRDWQRERYTMPLVSAELLANTSGVCLPDVEMRDRYAHTSSAGAKGYGATVRKYGGIPKNETLRLESWNKWRKGFDSAIEVALPEKCPELAEFCGIMLGDGGVSTYQAVISLNRITDLEYSDFVVDLIQRLFGYRPAVRHRPARSVLNIVLSRIKIVRYLHELGLPIGNKVKQHIDIPPWIKENPEYAIACIRGLVDTDGSMYRHSYESKGKRYSYKNLSFTSASEALVQSVHTILMSLGLHPRITHNGLDVRLESKADVAEYFKLIGSHNPKHLIRYAN